MAIIDGIKAGELGTPEQQRFFRAVGQLAGVVAGGDTALELVAVPETDVFIYEEANAAAASAMKRTIRFELRDANGVVQTWYNGQATLTPAEAVTDADVGVPVVTGGNTVDFVDGVSIVEIALDTDANSTKTYADADEVSVTGAIADIMGVAVDVTAAAYTLTAEATPLLLATPLAPAPTAVQANVAGASSMRQGVSLSLEDSEGNVLDWTGTLTVTVTPTEDVTDADVDVPELIDGSGVGENEYDLVNGVGYFEYAYDTDGGSAKTYEADDFVTLTPSCEDVGSETPDVTGATVVATFV
jgi:hypothetical protein